MQDRTKAQISIGMLAFFSSMWIILEHFRINNNLIYALVIIIVLLIVLLVLSYIIIGILDWINIFDLKINAILTLIVLTSFMLSLTIYLLLNNA